MGFEAPFWEGTMKKALILAAAVAALSASSNAMAWGPGRGLLDLRGRVITADGLGPIGVVDMVTPIGREGPYCTYLLNWGSPFNPNDVTTCVLAEVRTAVDASCIMNAYDGFNASTAVLAGTFAGYGAGFCQGFDLLGVPFNVDIVAGSRGNDLAGVVLYESCIALPFEIC
jgi:hypothetical protein